MKILQLFWWITSILLVNVLTGCEKRDAVLPVLTSSQSEIEAAIDELPQRLRCNVGQSALAAAVYFPSMLHSHLRKTVPNYALHYYVRVPCLH